MLITETYADEINEKIFKECMTLKENGKKVVGTYCAFTPKEIIAAAGAIPVSLCAGSYESAKKSEVHLPRNLCDLIKSSYGHGLSDSCPYFYFSDFLVADATCDGKKKMFELLSEMKPMHVLDLPQTYSTEGSYQFFKNELMKIKTYMEEKIGGIITAESLNKSIKDYNALRKVNHRLYLLNTGTFPLIHGSELRNISNGISFECNLDTRIEEIETMIETIKKRAYDSDFLRSVDGKHRILLTGCPTTNSKLVDIIEANDAIVVATENCGGLKTITDLVEEDTDDPIEALSRSYLSVACPCMTPNDKRFRIIDGIVKDYRIDAVIELTWHGCHTYNTEANLVMKHVTQTCKIPYLQIETDYSEGDAGQISTRVQALLELL